MKIVRERVKPERDRNRRSSRRQRWWRYGEVAPELYRNIADLDRVIVMPQVSRMILPLMFPTKLVFSHSLGVIADDSYTLYGVLSSQVHRIWARKYGSTHLSITNYNLVKCFETFPFLPESAFVNEAMSRLELFRANIMRETGRGLTALCQQMNKVDVVDSDITELRALHVLLDRVVCDAYGWYDLDLDHGFHETDEGVRWTISEPARIELLDRLLELNQDRHSHELAQGLVVDRAGSNGKHVNGEKMPRNNEVQALLLGDDGY